MNWGCRSTSIALYKLLSNEFDMSPTIGKRTIGMQPMPVGVFGFHVRYFVEGKHRGHARRLAQSLLDRSPTLSKLLGLQGFVVDYEPAKSVDRLAKHRRHYAELETIYRRVQDSDIVVINGEGSMIFRTPTRKDILFQCMIIELANRLNKPVFYVNAIFSDCPSTGRNERVFSLACRQLHKCSRVSLRDPVSCDYLKRSAKIKDAAFIPDALFTWYDVLEKKELPADTDMIIPHPETEDLLHGLDFSGPYVCVSGSSFASKARDREKAVGSYVALINRLKSLEVRIYLVATCTGDRFLQEVGGRTEVTVIPVNTNIFVGAKILSNARLFISGRYHPSILASLGGTPCIFLGSNSHKTRSIQEVLEYDEVREFPLWLSDESIESIMALCRTHLDAGQTLRDRLRQTARKRARQAGELPSFIEQGLLVGGSRSLPEECHST